MGLLGLVSRSLCNVSGFVYPCYASYKALTTRDHGQLERWLVYWCVMGTWTAAEGATAWVLAWVPFYQEAKLAVVLWMVAPQSEGSTLLYQRYLYPLFTSHEKDVDEYLGDLRFIVGGWLQRGFAAVWTLARERLNLAAFMPEAPPTTRPSSSSAPPFDDPNSIAGRPSSSSSSSAPIPSSLHSGGGAGGYNAHAIGPQDGQPHSQAFNYAASLVQQYAPLVLGGGAVQGRFGDPSSSAGGQQQARNLSNPRSTQTFEANQPRAVSTPGGGGSSLHASSSSASAGSSGFSSSRPSSTADVRTRRAQLEAELAALASPPSHLPGGGIGGGSRPPSPLARADSPMARSGYDEIGRDEVDDEFGKAGVGAGGAPGAGAGSGSWFGWGASPKRAGYQKVSKVD